MKHTCHLPICKAACPPAHLYCRAHWSMVPADLKDEVYRTVRMRGRNVDKTWAPWWRAQAEAEAALLRKLVPQDEARIAFRLAKAHRFADEIEGRRPAGEPDPSRDGSASGDDRR